MRTRASTNFWITLGGATAAAIAVRTAIRRRRKIDLAGKAVLITGGSRGLGLVLAEQFGVAGARVAIAARDERELQVAVARLRKKGIVAEAIRCDVTDRDDVANLIEAVEHQFGRVDILVNNAGIISVAPMDHMTRRDYDSAMATHFHGPFNTTEAVLPLMRRQGGGRIVNISSIGGKIAIPHLLPYSASKFALVGYSEGLRAELLRENIYVTTVCPGLMRTGSPRNATFKGKHRLEYAWFILGDSLPGSSISAERAARRIIDACVHGEAEVVLSLPAQLAARFHGLFPGLFSEIAAIGNRLLPSAGGIGAASARGFESESSLTRNPATALTRAAERKNNQMAGIANSISGDAT